MADQRSQTNMAMVLHLLQDRLTSGYLPKQWGHRPHALLMTSEVKPPRGGADRRGKYYTQGMAENNIGIYKVKVGNLYYIGSSTNLKGRKQNHLKELRDNTHKNHLLQAEFKKTQTYDFTILAICEWHEVRILEQDYLDRYFDSARCCNIERYAVSETRPTRRLKKPKR